MLVSLPVGFSGKIEFSASFVPHRTISHVLFDFDVTLSLIRQGWPEVMLPMFEEMVPRQTGESAAELRQLLLDDIMRLNGKQTIYQMMQLAERVKERGGQPRDPLWYKHEYLRRLDERIRSRLDGLRDGSLGREAGLVYGARELLELLAARQLPMYLASGTDIEYVRDEAASLGLAEYFSGGIYGALENLEDYSKAKIIADILRSHHLQGSGLVTFGDGYVEIENTVAAGGLAVGVASDESHPGKVDSWKR